MGTSLAGNGLGMYLRVGESRHDLLVWFVFHLMELLLQCAESVRL
jgi:hypothetical protein